VRRCCSSSASRRPTTCWSRPRRSTRPSGNSSARSRARSAAGSSSTRRPAEAYQKYYGDPKESYRIWASRPEVKQFSLEWYRFQWETYWFARQAGQKDGKFKEIADKFYRTARSTDDFASLKKHGAEGLELFNFFRANR
jgi:hypothetical protein